MDSKTVTYAMLRQRWNVVKGDLVGVTRSVLSVLSLVEGNSSDNSRLSVLELSVSTEIGSLFLI